MWFVRFDVKPVDVFESFEPDLIVMDQNMQGLNGIETMAHIKGKNPSIIVLILTAYGSIPLMPSMVSTAEFTNSGSPVANVKVRVSKIRS